MTRPRIIGVIDVRDGRAVHARAGRRAEYAPIEVAAGVRVDGDPTLLARVYAEQLGVRELYVADLDAIEGRRPPGHAILGRIQSEGVPVWVDAGVTAANEGRDLASAGVAHVVVGLETLASFRVLRDICAAVDGARVAFSLDLRDGLPMAMPNDAGNGSLIDVVWRAVDAGVGSVIVLDVARVGTGAGVDTALVEHVRRVAVDVTLVAGGGVRDEAEVDRLGAAGCDALLVATALLSGQVRAVRAET